MLLFLAIAVFILGTMFGSFASVLVERLKSGEDFVANRSRCPHCKHPLGASVLVPVVSYAVLGGKCKYCRAKILPLYPLMELTMGLAFTGVFVFAANPAGLVDNPAVWAPRTAVLLFTAFVLMVTFWYDAKHREVPDAVLIPATLLVLAGLAGNPFLASRPFSFGFVPVSG